MMEKKTQNYMKKRDKRRSEIKEITLTVLLLLCIMIIENETCTIILSRMVIIEQKKSNSEMLIQHV